MHKKYSFIKGNPDDLNSFQRDTLVEIEKRFEGDHHRKLITPAYICRDPALEFLDSLGQPFNTPRGLLQGLVAQHYMRVFRFQAAASLAAQSSEVIATVFEREDHNRHLRFDILPTSEQEAETRPPLYLDLKYRGHTQKPNEIEVGHLDSIAGYSQALSIFQDLHVLLTPARKRWYQKNHAKS